MYWYNSRWYDGTISHFIQADSIIPGVGNPTSFNRYAYAFYSPVTYSDPDGHWGCREDFDGGSGCGNRASNLVEEEYKKATIEYPWFADTISKKIFTAGKIYFDLFEKNPELGQINQQNQTDQWRWAMTYSEYAHHRYDANEGFYMRALETGKQEGNIEKIITGIMGIGDLMPFMGLFAKGDQGNTRSLKIFLPASKTGQANRRGWAFDDILEVYRNPAQTRNNSNITNRANGNPVTYYYRPDGHYVVIDDITGQVVQVSNTFDTGWIDEMTNLPITPINK